MSYQDFLVLSWSKSGGGGLQNFVRLAQSEQQAFQKNVIKKILLKVH